MASGERRFLGSANRPKGRPCDEGGLLLIRVCSLRSVIGYDLFTSILGMKRVTTFIG